MMSFIFMCVWVRGVGVLAEVCREQWMILGEECSGLHQLVIKHGVKGLLEAGLEAGLSQCRRDWATELSLHWMGRFSDSAVEAPAWGGYGEGGGVGYHEARREPRGCVGGCHGWEWW